MAERRGKRDTHHRREEREFDQRLIEISRVTRVMAGGKRMKFRACVVIGDRKGRLWYALAKGADVSLAVAKAVTKAKKDLIAIPIVNDTIAHEVKMKFKAARILLRPAPPGTGIMAGGAVRAALEISGIGNIVTKMYGSKNKVNNIKALFSALKQLQETHILAPHIRRVKKDAPAPAEQQA
ncbi:30S ribosomal protein S5 [Candidatus Uhrbacteria bacterium]|nr:30S ribosomal protein S5 [Candidatus Uhrbacteria bacterium]